MEASQDLGPCDPALPVRLRDRRGGRPDYRRFAWLSAWPITILATALSYLSGMTLGLLPVMKGQGIGLFEALRIIWIGEVISIGVMEIVMNFVDYHLGGMSSGSIARMAFWRGLLVAIPASSLLPGPSITGSSCAN